MEGGLTHEELNLVDLLRLKTLSKDVFRNCLIITMSRFGDTIGHIAERLGCSAETVVRIRRESIVSAESTLSSRRNRREDRVGRPRVHRGYERSRGYRSSGSGLRILCMVHQTIGGPPQENHGNRLQRRSVESAAASPWLLGPASQTHDEGQTRRSGLSASRRGTRTLEKKATGPTLRKS